jgi:quinol monooxygenase YgiN
MYARLVRFAIEPGYGAAAQAMSDDLAPRIADQPGCQGVTIFGEDGDGEYGIFVLWDTQEHAHAAAAIIRPALDEHLSGHVTRPPEPQLFPVISG